MLNRNLKILLYSSNIWYLGEGMFGPLLAVFTDKIGGSLLDISLVWSAYLITTGCFTVFVGKISDSKISKKKLLILGYALNAIFTFCYLFVASQKQLLFVQIGLGIASALATPTWNALYSEYGNYSKKKSTRYAWGLADGQSEIVTGVGILVGGLIVNSFSFNLLFIIMGIIQVMATFYVTQLVKS